MENIISFVSFIGLFLFFLSLVYLIGIGIQVIKVYTLREGKVELGKYGSLLVSMAITYILTYLIY